MARPGGASACSPRLAGSAWPRSAVPKPPREVTATQRLDFKRVRPLCMPRPFRIAYEGAIYHVTIRGNNDEAVFRDDQDYSAYLEQLAGTIGRFAISLL